MNKEDFILTLEELKHVCFLKGHYINLTQELIHKEKELTEKLIEAQEVPMMRLG